MHLALRPLISDRFAGCHGLALWLLAALATLGCRHEPGIGHMDAAKPPTVQILNPPIRKIVRGVGQPSFIEAYERTSIYSKPTAYIKKWLVDIGDRVKKGDVLATLFVPELEEDHGTRKARVVLDRERINLAKEVVLVAKADVKEAEAGVKEAEEILDIPEQDANFVHIGTKATVLVKAYRDEPFPASVTRTAWALNARSRTLRAEIDLDNPKSQLLPRMYAYVKVFIERPAVRALPLNALTYDADQTHCWMYENGHAVRTEIQTGVNDGQWIEVTSRRIPPSEAEAISSDPWLPIDGSERVIVSELSLLTDDIPVEVVLARARQQSPVVPVRPQVVELPCEVNRLGRASLRANRPGERWVRSELPFPASRPVFHRSGS
jgi:multidrug efflux pump subunit AcrA (membrane-fusion protein)